jgi:GT2 family glycosyltransferase
VSDGISVSFVVIAYNEAEGIGRALGAISALAGAGDHEVVVVNDGSRDRTGDVVAEIAARDRRVRLINLGVNHGRGYARRTGIAAARGELIAMVDADIILPADWLVRARAALRGHDAVGGTAVPDGDSAYLHRRFGLVPRLVGHTATVTGSNALYRRQVFDMAGFDPALREGEDIALNHAMKRHGLSAATVPGLVVRHVENKTLPASLRWLFVSGRSATRQMAEYREIRVPDLAAGSMVGLLALGLVLTARSQRIVGTVLPAAFLLTASIQHVRSRFETPWSQWTRVVPAIAVDSTLLTAYFAGRIAGVATLCRAPLPRKTLPRKIRRDLRQGSRSAEHRHSAAPSGIPLSSPIASVILVSACLIDCAGQ